MKHRSERVLLFHRNDLFKTYLDQLKAELDACNGLIDLIVCTKPDWIQIEGEIAPLVKARYESTHIRGYDYVTNNTEIGSTLPLESIKGQIGFNSIPYRGVPIVPMDASEDNIIGARLLVN